MSFAVSNSSPLIVLAKLDRFQLIHQLFRQVVIPDLVWHEVVVKGANRPGAEQARQAHQEGWLRTRPIQDKLAVELLQASLGAGEAEAIVLAHELKADWLLADDDLARAQAARLGIQVRGTAGILLAAHQAGLLDDLRAALDDLRAKGFWLGDKIYNAILTEANKG